MMNKFWQLTPPLIRGMLSLKLRCQINYSRLARDKFKHNKLLKMSNPGISNRLKIAKEDSIDQQTEGFDPDNMEPDLMEFDQMYTSYKRKIDNRKEKNQLQIVERKYFKKSTQPNFLTWSEKEQIRYLHETDAEAWSAENLAESFPAPESVIRKIIKSRWKPDDASQIDRHDKSVHNNWQLLHQGKLDIDPDLKTHLLQFGNREKNMPPVPNLSIDLVGPGPQRNANTSNGEFLNIIQSYKKSTTDSIALETKSLTVFPNMPTSQEKSDVENTLKYSRVPSGDTYTLDGSRQTKTDPHFTLSQYRDAFNSPPKVDYVQTETTVPKATSITVNYQQGKHHQFSTSENHNVAVTKGILPERAKSNAYLEKITIPKNKWKQGGTYKVGDCFYDDDGEFLYRVPGMT